MSPQAPPLPPKPEVALALLQTAVSVYVHLDPRSEEVLVPPWFKNQPQLVLQIGLNMAVPIPDLDVGREAISCTLSFNRRPEFCRIPWQAIYGLVGEDGRGMIWPESVPPEVASAAGGRATKKPHLRVAEGEATGAESQPEKAATPAKKQKTKAPARVQASRSSETGRSGGAVPPRAETPKPASITPPAAQNAKSNAGRRKELPPYLRIVK